MPVDPALHVQLCKQEEHGSLGGGLFRDVEVVVVVVVVMVCQMQVVVVEDTRVLH